MVEVEEDACLQRLEVEDAQEDVRFHRLFAEDAKEDVHFYWNFAEDVVFKKENQFHFFFLSFLCVFHKNTCKTASSLSVFRKSTDEISVFLRCAPMQCPKAGRRRCARGRRASGLV